MKTTLLLTCAALVASLSLADAQGPGGRRPGGRGPGGPGGPGGGGERPAPPAPAEVATHLAERYAALAAFDADKNGKLDTAEQEKIAAAIEDGSLEMGPPGGGRPGGPRPGGEGGKGGKGGEGGRGGRPPGKMVAAQSAKLYESLVPFDADKNGSLDQTEQAAVAKAIEDGSLKLPRPGGRGPGGPGGRGPGRPEGPPPGQ